jgi:hypothetical protein
MFLKFSTAQGSTSGLTFEDRDNFRAFKLVVQGDRAEFDAVRRATAGRAELPDEETAWIFEDTLRRWPDVENDTAWQEKFSAMIEKARPHGWIDDQRKAIKAHIEWTAAS